MSQRTLTNSRLKSDQSPSLLHPALQAALGNLDVSLEEELTWYRRQRAGYVSPPPRGLSRVLDHPLLNLSASSVPAMEAPTNAAALKPSGLSSGLNGEGNYSGSSAATLSASGSTVADRPLPPQSQMPLADNPTGSAPPYDYLESSEELLRSLADEEPTAKPTRSRWLSPLGLGALALFLLSSSALVYLLVKPDTLARLGLPGLKTSMSPGAERSPTDADSATNSPASPRAVPDAPNLADREFVDLNIDNLSSLETGRESLIASPSPSPSPANTAPAIPNSLLMRDLGEPATPASGESGTPGGTLGQRQPANAEAPNSAATPTQNSAQASRPQAQPQRSARQPVPTVPPLPRSENPRPAPRPAAKPSPAPRTTSTPQTPSTPPAASAPASQSPSRSYTVSTPYTGDAALDAARQVVPDAYVRNSSEGARIQLGSFTEPEKARQLADQLQQQGIQADVNPR